MYEAIVHFLQELKPPYILLVQASIIVAFPYFLWRSLGLERWFPLGVVQIFAGVLLGPGVFGALDAALLNPAPHFDPTKAVNACTNPQARELFNALFGVTCYHGNQVVNRAVGIASVATIAVCLFGFLAGTDADKELIRKSGKTVLSIGVFGMLFGWAVAIVAGYFLFYAFPEARGANATAFNFSIAYGLVIAVSALAGPRGHPARPRHHASTHRRGCSGERQHRRHDDVARARARRCAGARRRSGDSAR